MEKQDDKSNFIWVAEDKLLELFKLKEETIKQIRLIDAKGNEFIVKDVSDISLSYTKENNELTIFANVVDIMTQGLSSD